MTQPTEAFMAARSKWTTGEVMQPQQDELQVQGVPDQVQQESDQDHKDVLPESLPAPATQNNEPGSVLTGMLSSLAQAGDSVKVVLERVAIAIERVADTLQNLVPLVQNLAPLVQNPAPLVQNPAPIVAPPLPLPVAPLPLPIIPEVPLVHLAPQPPPPVAVEAAYDSEDDVDPATRCGVCKAGTEEQYALECGHYPYCQECVDKLKKKATFMCPMCKKVISETLKLNF